MGLANWLTIARILLVPVLVICLVYNRGFLALSTFIVAGVTDMMDGYIARTRGTKTRLGAFLDPLADKLLVTSLLIVLALPSPGLVVRVPPWIAILSIGRDGGILLAVLVFHLAGARRSFPPSFLGKSTTVAHLATILWILGCNFRGQDHPLTPILLGVTVVLVLVSGFHYLYLGQQVVAQATKEETGS